MNSDQLTQLCATIQAGEEAESELIRFVATNKEKILVDGMGFNTAKWLRITKIEFNLDGSPQGFKWEYDNDSDGDYVNFPASAYLDLDGWVATQKEKREQERKAVQQRQEEKERAEFDRLKRIFG